MKTISKRYNPLYAAMFVAVLGASTSPTLALAEAGAKSMFSDDDGTSVMMNEDADTPKTTSSQPKTRVSNRRSSPSSSSYEPVAASPANYAGIQYWIDLQGSNGRSQQVTKDHTFQSGDRIKMGIKSNTEGYLYVYNQDDSGKLIQLYPAKGQLAGVIQPNTTVYVPTHKAIYFDNKPGNEKVTIALSKHLLPDLHQNNSEMGTTASYSAQSSYGGCTGGSAGSKALGSEDDNFGIDCIRSNHSAGSKSLISEDDNASPEPASYSVVPASTLDKGDVLFVDLNLNHR
ncbi:MAG: DUF4384 domain-containing protein [Methylovulum sp.]|nr:DUF4384 domain-containing protein [Methylovulum sp.]